MSPTYVEEIEAALNRADWQPIERAAQALLMDENPLFLPIGGTHDFGRDAEILKLQDDVHHRYVAISDRKDWDRKIQDDVKRVRDAGFKVEEVLFCTPQSIPEGDDLDRVRQSLRKRDVELKLADRKWWITKLQQDSAVVRRVKREELHLAPYRPSPLREPAEYDEYLSGRKSYVLTALVGRDALIAQVAAALKEGVAVVLHGNLGSGKTRVAVEAAKRANALVAEASATEDPVLIEALLSGPERPVVIDDAHARSALLERLARARLDPAIKRPPALLLVSWSSSVELVRAAVSDAYNVVVIEVGGLPREQLAEILRDQFHLEEADRAAVLTNSEGLPLFAVLGALALGGGATREDVSRGNPLEAWFERVWPHKVAAGDAEMLAIIALRGGLRVIDRDGFTEEAKRAAEAAGLRPQELIPHLEPHLETGLLGYEDGRYFMTPDALCQLVVKRICFAPRPLVASPKALVEAAVTYTEAFARVSQLFDRIAEETSQAGPRRLLIDLLDESRPKPDAEFADWYSFSDYAKDLAAFAPEKALSHARAALEARPMPSRHPLLRVAYTTEGLRRKVCEIGEAALFGGNEADFRAALTLLLDLASSEPLVQDQTGLSQSRAPVMHGLLQLAERFNPRGQRSLPYAIRTHMGQALYEWWKGAPKERADRTLLLLTRLLDPGVFASVVDADRPHQINMTKGFLNAGGYGAIAGEIVGRIEEILPDGTDEGGRSVLSQLDHVLRAARGISGAFNAIPDPALQQASKEVACRILAALAKRFGDNPAFMYRIHEQQAECECSDASSGSDEEHEIEILFTYERGENWHEEQKKRFVELGKIAASLDGASIEDLAKWISRRTTLAAAAGLDLGTTFCFGFVEELGRRRPAEAARLARLLIDDPNTRYLAEHPLIELEDVWDKGGRELLDEWLVGDKPEKWALWSLLTRVPGERLSTVQKDLLLRALPAADDAAARLVDVILIRLAGGPDAGEILGAALRSGNSDVKRVAVMMSCLNDKAHAHHIPVRSEDQEAFKTALMETAQRAEKDSTGGMVSAAKETLSEIIELDRGLAEDWLRARLKHLASDPGHYVEPFSHGEEQALASARGKFDGLGLLDDFAALDEVVYSQREAYEDVLQSLVADLPEAVARRLERGDLDKEKVYRLLRIVPRGTGWPRLITSAAAYMSEDELFSAVHDATFNRGVITGSLAAASERQRDFFEGMAADPNKVVASIARKLAELYARQAERERREELREQYER